MQPTLGLPSPIKAAPYLNGIQWGRLGTPEEAAAKTELSRMLQIFERFGAQLQPIRYRDGRTVWSVMFPKGCRWRSGPEQPGAWLAVLESYARNDKFRGYLASGMPEQQDLRRLDSIIDASLDKDKRHYDDLRAEAVDQFTFAAHETAERLGFK